MQLHQVASLRKKVVPIGLKKVLKPGICSVFFYTPHCLLLIATKKAFWYSLDYECDECVGWVYSSRKETQRWYCFLKTQYIVRIVRV